MAARAGSSTPSRHRIEPVSLDIDRARLQRGGRIVGLRPKDLAVLRTLIGAHNRLLRKETLLEAGWPDVSVTDSVLKACINRLRIALGDNPKDPRFIQTAPRQGYRFVGDITLADDLPAAAPCAAEPEATRPPAVRPIVGRADELAHLDRAFAEATSGTRRVLFVAGEAGVGKTALVDLFLETRVPHGTLIGRGQSIEQYGAGDAYGPLLEALGAIARGPGRRVLASRLASHAPSWLPQVPGLLSARRRNRLRARAAAVTRERMLREMADALETIAARQPLVLVIEDLHWSDASTLDVIGILARRRNPARLLIVGTYRPEDVGPGDRGVPGLVRELRLQRLAREVSVSPLGESAVAAYLALRFPGAGLPAGCARTLHSMTDGHPLFMVTMADDWVSSGWITHARGRWRASDDAFGRDLPDDLRRMIESRLDRLPPEDRRVIDAASVAGATFSAAGVAAALGTAPADVDDRCDALARRQFLIARDGTERARSGRMSGQYRFLHALYQSVAYARVPVARRQDLHRRIASGEEAHPGSDGHAAAARLAAHFEQAGDAARAARYRAAAAQSAVALNGFEEAIAHAAAGLDLLGRAPDPLPDRAVTEMHLQLSLGGALAATRGFAAAAAERAFARAAELSRTLEGRSDNGQALAGLYAYHLMRGPVSTTSEIAARLTSCAEQRGDHAFLTWSRMAVGVERLQAGRPLDARAALEGAWAQYDAAHRDDYLAVHTLDPGVAILGYLAWCLTILGLPAEGLSSGQASMALGRDTGQPIDVAHALVLHAHLRHLRGERAEAIAAASQAIEISDEHGLGQYLWPARIVRGWGLVMDGDAGSGLEHLQLAIDFWKSMGATYSHSRHLTLLGEALRRAGRPAEALAAVDAAAEVVEATGERCWEPELHRLRAEFLLELAAREASAERQRLTSLAQTSAERAAAIAAAQGARLFEQRAASLLSRIGAA